jgi:phage terminase large subunit-like protein
VRLASPEKLREKLSTLPEGVRQEAEKALAEFERYQEINPLLRYNVPGTPKRHEKQLEFHASRDPVKCFVGGNRSGKTTAGIADDLIQAVDAELLPPHLAPYKRWDPPFYCRIITPDFTATMEGVIFQKLRELCPKEALVAGRWEKAYDKQRRRLHFQNGSWFDFLTYEQDLDKFGGAELHRIHYDEEPPGEKGRQIRQECRMRLMSTDGDEVFTLTPLLGLSWFYEEVWEQRFSEGITVVQVDMDDNPWLTDQAKDRLLAGMTTEETQARKSGRFVHFSGLFYEEFGNEHIAPTPDRKHVKQQSIVVGIDPGLNFTGVVWVAFDEDNSALVFTEFLGEQLVVKDIAEAIRAKNKEWGIDPDFYVIDPSARNRAMGTGEQVEAEYIRQGIPVSHGVADRAVGILEVKRRLQQKTLFVSEECDRLLWEFPRYRKDPNSRNEFDAVKQNDHELDALRYALMSRAWGSTSPEPPEKHYGINEVWPRKYRQPAGPGQSEVPPTGAMT